jgi:Na+/melibiose symporter-like transporter
LLLKNPVKFFLSKEAEDGYIPNRELTSHAAGLAGQNLAYAYIAGWLFYFCTNVLKISPKKVGIITGISRAWDAFNDPLVGGYIDKRSSRPGISCGRT